MQMTSFFQNFLISNLDPKVLLMKMSIYFITPFVLPKQKLLKRCCLILQSHYFGSCGGGCALPPNLLEFGVRGVDATFACWRKLRNSIHQCRFELVATHRTAALFILRLVLASTSTQQYKNFQPITYFFRWDTMRNNCIKAIQSRQCLQQLYASTILVFYHLKLIKCVIKSRHLLYTLQLKHHRSINHSRALIKSQFTQTNSV